MNWWVKSMIKLISVTESISYFAHHISMFIYYNCKTVTIDTVNKNARLNAYCMSAYPQYTLNKIWRNFKYWHLYKITYETDLHKHFSIITCSFQQVLNIKKYRKFRACELPVFYTRTPTPVIAKSRSSFFRVVSFE